MIYWIAVTFGQKKINICVRKNIICILYLDGKHKYYDNIITLLDKWIGRQKKCIVQYVGLLINKLS